MTPIIDLHCDLLLYLSGKDKDPYSPTSRCSLPLLEEGGVGLQTLAIYTATKPGSHKEAMLQLECYKKLPQASTKFLVAIENASGLLEEGEDLGLLFKRLDHLQKEAGPLLYISLTWNTENRFGGGNETHIGLKSDGEALLEYIAGKGIAIDLSHTSDPLAHEILNFIDKKNLKIQPMASHSNFRAICNVPRNLPDDLASEIIRRKGVIGLNFVRKFVGEDFVPKMVEMIQHAKSLNGLDSLVFGADFFYNEFTSFFFEEFGNASCYQRLVAILREHFSHEIVEKIAYKNASHFLEGAHDHCW